MGFAMMVVQLEIPDGWEDSLLVGTVDTSVRGPLDTLAVEHDSSPHRVQNEARKRVQA